MKKLSSIFLSLALLVSVAVAGTTNLDRLDLSEGLVVDSTATTVNFNNQITNASLASPIEIGSVALYTNDGIASGNVGLNIGALSSFSIWPVHGVAQVGKPVTDNIREIIVSSRNVATGHFAFTVYSRLTDIGFDGEPSSINIDYIAIGQLAE